MSNISSLQIYCIENTYIGMIKLNIVCLHIHVSHVQWGLHLRIGSTSEPFMHISFHLLQNNDPKIAEMLWT